MEPKNTISKYLDLCHLQVAAEALLDVTPDLKTALEIGNKHNTKLTPTEAEDFVARFDVVAHKPNTNTGFSGTLFKAKDNDAQSGLQEGQYFLVFRSTEFVDDAIRDSEGTNMSIAKNGWAFGQICAMEEWYKGLLDSKDLPATGDLTIVGYSLGGHLANAFRLLRQEENNPREFPTYSYSSKSQFFAWNFGKSLYTFNCTEAGAMEICEGRDNLEAANDGSFLRVNATVFRDI